MAQQLDQQQYPSGVNPQLIKEGEFVDDGTIEDSDLQAKQDDHVGFVRKVLGIVACQMALTFAFSMLASASPSAGKFFRHPGVLIFSVIGLIASICILSNNKALTRKVPENYILLTIGTVCEAAIIASLAAELTEASVLMAIMATCVSTLGLYFAAVFTSTRQHMQRNLITGLVISIFVDLGLLIFMLFFMNFKDRAMVFAISLIVVLISGIFIIFDLLLIILPSAIDKEDYILAALNLYPPLYLLQGGGVQTVMITLYLDIARLFYHLMIIFGEKK